MNKIENIHTAEELERIIEDVVKTVNMEEYGEFRNEKMILVFCLWKIQTDTTIKTVEDLQNAFWKREYVDFGVYAFDDITWELRDSEEEWKRLNSLKGKYSDQELAECLLFTDFFDNENEIIPNSICDLVDKIMNIKKNESILHLNTGEGEFPIFLSEKHPENRIEAYDSENYPLTRGAVERDIRNLNIKFTIGLEEEWKFDKVLTTSFIDPASTFYSGDINEMIKAYDKEYPLGNSGTWNSFEWGIFSTKEKGKTFSIMNSGDLTIKQTFAVRKHLCDGGFIEGIIKLPEKMYTNVWVNPYLVISSRNNKSIKFLDASKEYVSCRVKGKKINTLSEENIDNILADYKKGKNVISVNIKAVKENDYSLDPLRYILNNDSCVKKIELGDVLSDIKRGVSLKAADMDEYISQEPSDVKCILPNSIGDGVISSNLFYHGPIKKPGKNMVGRYDVLLGKTGSPFKTALSYEQYLVVGNLYILEFHLGEINPAYVKCFLSSEQGQNEIRKYAVGSPTPIISIENIRKIQIPVYENKLQKEINAKCEKLVSEFERLNKQISDCKQEINSIFEGR